MAFYAKRLVLFLKIMAINFVCFIVAYTTIILFSYATIYKSITTLVRKNHIIYLSSKGQQAGQTSGSHKSI